MHGSNLTQPANKVMNDIYGLNLKLSNLDQNCTGVMFGTWKSPEQPFLSISDHFCAKNSIKKESCRNSQNDPQKVKKMDFSSQKCSKFS